MVSASRAVLADQVFPTQSTLLRETALVLGGVALTAVAAQIQVPVQPVPFTLQTLAVGACGLLLGSKRGALSQIAYIVAGAVGLPAFAGFRFGPQVLAGPTGGYLVAFVLAAYLTGLIAERGLDRKVWTCFLALVTIMGSTLSLGTTWLAGFTGSFQSALMLGVVPFILPELFKAAILAFGVPATWHLIHLRQNPPAKP